MTTTIRLQKIYPTLIGTKKMTLVFNKRLNNILGSSLTPYLKSLGFKKSKNNYTRDLGEMAYIINIQKSRWDDKEEAKFTFNCGIYVPEVFSIYSNIENISKPQIENCSKADIFKISKFLKDQGLGLTKNLLQRLNEHSRSTLRQSGGI